MVDHESPLSVRRQCELLRVSRSGLYYEPVATSPEELALMRCLDERHLTYPFYGSRKLSLELRDKGHDANRKRVQRLMRVMGLEAMVPKPRTSEPHPEHPVYPYLLRGLDISRPNHVWATDITYIPMAHGFVVRRCHRRALRLNVRLLLPVRRRCPMADAGHAVPALRPAARR